MARIPLVTRAEDLPAAPQGVFTAELGADIHLPSTLRPADREPVH